MISKKYITNFVLQIVSFLTAYLLQFVFVEQIGTSGFGVYTILVSAIGLISLLIVPGTDLHLLQIVSVEKGHKNRIHSLQCALMITFILSIGLVIFLASLEFFSSNASSYHVGGYNIAYLPAVAFFCAGQKYIDYYSIAVNRAHLPQFISISRSILRVALVFLLPLVIKSSYVVVLIILFETLINILVQLRKLNITFDWKLKCQTNFKSLFKPTLYANTVIDGVYPFLDKLLVGLLVGYVALGQFKIIESYSAIVSFAITPFMFLWKDFASVCDNSDIFKIRDIYQKALYIISTVAFCILLMCYNFSSIYYDLFQLEQTDSNLLIFALLISGFLVDALCGPAGALLKLGGHSKIALSNNIITMIIYVCLLPFTINNFGVVGAAISKLVLNLSINLANLIAIKSAFGVYMINKKYLYYVAFIMLYALGMMYLVSPNTSIVYTSVVALLQILPIAIFYLIATKYHENKLSNNT